MNIVFFGSSQFAVSSLRALLTTQHKVSCVVTQPDRQKGRGLRLEGTIVKAVAEESGLEFYQPDRINTSEAIRFLKDLNPDLFVVIAYGQILSKGILGIPKIFSLNVHASLLPLYRGAAPINWAIINGETKTGITVIKIAKQMDAGPIILQETIDINGDDTAITLEDRLSQMAAQRLLESIKFIENNNYQFSPQDENKVSFAPKLKKSDGKINWNKPAYSIYNLVKGCLPWPGAFTDYKGKLLKIYKAKVIESPSRQVAKPPGEIMQIFKKGIVVATAKDSLIIEELQMEGKRRMKAEEFITGHKICEGEAFNY